MAALIECELAAHNKPNLHMSMAFTHTAILIKMEPGDQFQWETRFLSG